MTVQVPEYFLNHTDVLKLKNLSIMYYFNRKKSQKTHVQINKHMLLHIFNGSKIICINDKEYIITERQSVFLSSGQYLMSEVLSPEKSHFNGIMVFFDDMFLFSFFSKYKNFKNKKTSPDTISHRLCIIENSPSLHATMLSCRSYIERKNDNSALIQLKLEEIFLQLIQSNDSNEILDYFQSLYRTSLFKYKHIFEKHDFRSVKEMIKASKLPELQFRKIFKQIYNTTPKEWLTERALHKAKALLQNKELNVTDVCYECGFNSLSWFIKSFKNTFGTTPKKYQQNC